MSALVSPGIQQLAARSSEVLFVSSYHNQIVRNRCSCDQSIRHWQRLPRVQSSPAISNRLTHRQQVPPKGSQGPRHPRIQVSGLHRIATTFFFNTSPDLAHRDGAHKHLVGRHTVEPTRNSNVHLLPLSEFRDHIGIQKEGTHSSTCRLLGGLSRRSMLSSIPKSPNERRCSLKSIPVGDSSPGSAEDSKSRAAITTFTASISGATPRFMARRLSCSKCAGSRSITSDAVMAEATFFAASRQVPEQSSNSPTKPC